MHYFCISWTHKNTDLCLREQFAFANEAQKTAFLEQITEDNNTLEALILSTCNRVELIAYVKDLSKASSSFIKKLSLFFKLESASLSQRADFYEDIAAIHHLFSVASSLDSLVIGETQIAGQLKEAFLFALERQFCGVHLSRAIHAAFKCAAKVRNETQISKNPISVASVAVAKAKELVNLQDKKVLVVGAGQMSELVCKHLLSQKAKITLISKNRDKAREFAANLDKNIELDSLENLAFQLNNSQLIFSATNAPNAVITQDLLEKVPFKRYFFDIAVPRDIDIKKDEQNEVFYVDDLQSVVNENLALREEQAHLAYAIIGRVTNEFYKNLEQFSSNPLIKALHLYAKHCEEEQLQKAIAKKYLKHSDINEARKLIHQVLKAFLDTPFTQLKSLDDKVQNQNVINALSYVFKLGNSNLNNSQDQQ